jgi:hypothetical protein
MANNIDCAPISDQKIYASMIPTLYGWPASGGVWVFKPTDEEWEEYNRLPVTTEMEEHCANLEMFGAIFYEDINECAEARDAVAMHA